MDTSYDVFLTNLPRSISEVVVKNLFSSAGNVLKVKIIDDKKNENLKLCFVGFGTMDEALEAVRIADNSDAFGDPIKASISKKCLEGMENSQNRNVKGSNSRPLINNAEQPTNRFMNVGRGRGLQNKTFNNQPAFTDDVKLSDMKLKLKELIDVEIIELNRIDYIYARPIKLTENSKIEITALLSKINSQKSSLISVEHPKLNNCYLAKWEDDSYYRAELLEILGDGSFKVAFVDEGTSGDIVRDIKYIPSGSLQQYPKQYLKLSLGCPDDKELKLFVMQESDDKSVKVYWLGEHVNNSIPLVNLFLNEDEIVEKFIQTHKKLIRDKFIIKFEDLPTHLPGKIPNVEFLQSLYKTQFDFVLNFQDAPLINLKNKKSPLVLPTPGDICIYEKRNSTGSQLFRCLIRRRQLFSFDIQLLDTGERISNVNIDYLYTPEDFHKCEPPFSISCELDRPVSCDENSLLKMLSGESAQFTIIQFKKNNRYIVSYDVPIKKMFEYVDINYNEFVGKSYNVSVSHCISPINFYVQICRDDYFKILTDIQDKINANYESHSFKNLDEIKLNQAVVAPFNVPGSSTELFRAKVIEKRRESPQVHVLYIDYGNDEWVDLKELLNVDDELVANHGLALPCKLNLDIKKEAWAHASDMFSQIVGFPDMDEFGMQVFRISDNKFIVDLVSQMKGSIISILEKSGVCTIANDDKPKPVCNGDKSNKAKDSFSKPNGIPNKENKNYTEVKFQKNSDDELILKVSELERRVSELERLLLKE